MKRIAIPTAILALALAFSGPALSEDQSKIAWTPGPATVTIGDNIAQVDLAEGYIFAGPEDTRRIMEMMGNPSDGSEAGMVAPRGEGKNWFIVFEYNPIGYVPDDDKDKIDADAILEGIKKGTEKANEIRAKRGESKLSIIGWQEKPRYDQASHNLVWALLAQDDQGRKIINYNTRLLGRHGFMSTTLVATPEELEATKPEVEKVIGTFRFVKGKGYAEFVKGDKVAKYGLTALVAGGAGVAAAKLGFFKFFGKFFKAIIVFVVAAGAAFLKKIRSIFGREKEKIHSGPAPQ